MTEHLGYDKSAVQGRGSGNSRNGTRTKTVTTDNVGSVPIGSRGIGRAASSRRSCVSVTAASVMWTR